jgi:hypothetical protein
MRELSFVFHAPSTQGAYYDPTTKTSFIFSLNPSEEELEWFIKEIEQTITHETIHYAIQKICRGRKITRSFDKQKLLDKICQCDKEVYNMLY